MQRYFLLMGGIVAVGASGLLARMGLEGGLDALQLALWRLTLAGSVLIAWQWISRGRADPDGQTDSPVAASMPPREQLRLMLAGACLAFHFVTWFASLQYVPIARSTLMVTTSPLWAGLIGLFVPGLRVGRGFWPGLAVAAPGIFLVTTQGASSSHFAFAGRDAAWQGDLLAATGGLLVVPYLLLVQRAQLAFGTLRAVTWAYGSAAACLWLIALPQREGRLPPTPAAWASVLSMALVPQLLGHTALNRSLRHFSAAQVSAATLLEPVIAAFLAWLLLRESVSIGQMAGAALLLCGVWFALRARRASSSLPTPADA